METPSTESTVFGVKVASLVFGFLGSALSLSYAKEMSRRQAATAVAAGTIIAVAVEPLVLHYLALPPVLGRAVAFVLGLVAMRLVPAVLSLTDRVKDAKLPVLPDSKE